MDKDIKIYSQKTFQLVEDLHTGEIECWVASRVAIFIGAIDGRILAVRLCDDYSIYVKDFSPKIAYEILSCSDTRDEELFFKQCVENFMDLCKAEKYEEAFLLASSNGTKLVCQILFSPSKRNLQSSLSVEWPKNWIPPFSSKYRFKICHASL